MYSRRFRIKDRVSKGRVTRRAAAVTPRLSEVEAVEGSSLAQMHDWHMITSTWLEYPRSWRYSRATHADGMSAMYGTLATSNCDRRPLLSRESYVRPLLRLFGNEAGIKM